MIEQKNYDLMKDKYGIVGSWAIWRPVLDKPKSNTNNMSWIDDSDLLEKLNTGYVFVGLNWSSTHGEASGIGVVPWANFHSGYSRQNDYKLRYALEGTKFWGSYMTDVIKFYKEVDSSKVSTYLKDNPEFVEQNIKEFEEEISYLGEKPVLIALGAATYNILKKYLAGKYEIVQVMHYSMQIGKENYREEVLKVLANY